MNAWDIAKLIAITLDIVGGVLVTIAVIITANQKPYTNYSLTELESSLQSTVSREVRLSKIGLLFIVAGFVLLFICEVHDIQSRHMRGSYSVVKKKR
jgi:uncharacterized membrane protein